MFWPLVFVYWIYYLLQIYKYLGIHRETWNMILDLFFRMQKLVMILAATILTLILATPTPGSTGKSESSKDNQNFIPRIYKV